MIGKVWLRCDRWGKPRETATVRKSGSKKIGCPFKVVGVYSKSRGVFKVEVRCDTHNHPRGQHMEGHAHARRLSNQEIRLVEQLTEQNVPPRNILSTIKNQNPDNVSVLKTIYNAQAKIRDRKRVGETPMQILENVLRSKGYVYHTREDPSTNITEEIFFCNPTAHATWRAFPHVLMIDATYKTNMYRLPFVQIIGVTSTLRSFSIAHAFLTKEREENYTWMLERMKEMLKGCFEPRVIITDRELALVNACEKVFPQALQSLCRWHISENIAKHCKATFGRDTVYSWKKFMGQWGNLCESATERAYDYNWNTLYMALTETGRISKLT